MPQDGRGNTYFDVENIRIRDPEKTHYPMKIRKGVQKLSEAVFCIPHRRDNAFFPSS